MGILLDEERASSPNTHASFHSGLPVNCPSYWYKGLSFWSECTVGLAKASIESADRLNSPSVQPCFLHFTSVSQGLISVALPISSYTLVSWESFSQGTPSSTMVAGCVVQPLLRILPSLFSTRAQVCVTAPNTVQLLCQGLKSEDS